MDAADDRGIDAGSASGADADVDGTGVDGSRRSCRPLGPVTFGWLRSASTPSLAFDGTGYGLVWVDTPVGSSCGFDTWRFAHIEEDGVIRVASMELSPSPTADARASLSWVDGAFTATLITDEGDGPGVYFYRVAADGTQLVPPRRVTEEASSHETVPTRDGYAVAWAGADVHITLLDADGGPTGMDSIFPVEPGWLRLSGGGDGLALLVNVALQDYLHVRLDPYGTPVGRVTRLCCEETGRAYVGGMGALAAFPRGSLVLWQDLTTWPRPLVLTRFDGSGAPVEETAVTPPSRTSHASVAVSAGEIGAVWRDDRTGELQIYFARFDETGARLEPDRPLTAHHGWIGCSVVDEMSIVATGSGYAVAWTEVGVGHRPDMLRFAHVCPE